MSERQHLEEAIRGLEAQRAVLGEAAADAAIAAVRDRLALIDRQGAQRRYATVLFADVAGFTSMSEKLDPEEVRDAMNEAWRLLDAVIIQHGGIIDKHIGDAVMAVFGVPTAREDDAERAVRAALSMQSALAGMAGSHPLSMRVGLHTGLLAWGSVGSVGEQTAMGDTVNLASRLEHAAPKSGILISHEVYRHVRGVFELIEHPLLSVKGKAAPIRVYEVRGARSGGRRSSIDQDTVFEPPFLGRDEEISSLLQVFEETLAGASKLQVVLGHAGQGKSRLMAAFSERMELHARQPRIFRAGADASCLNRPYGLLRDLLLFFLADDDSDTRLSERARLMSSLREIMGSEADIVAPYLASVAGLTETDDLGPTSLPGEAERIRSITFDSFVRFFEAAARSSPTVVLLEDVHQADPTSLDLIELVLERCRERSLLFVATGRFSLADTRPSWCADDGEPKALKLSVIPREACVRLARDLLAELSVRYGAKQQDPAELFADAADGNPFYLQEIVRLYIEKGLQSQDEHKVEIQLPGTLKAVFQARQDLLSLYERKILRRASVIGDRFSPSVLSVLGEPDDPDPAPALTALTVRDYIRRVADGEREAGFVFGHALVRQFAYESIPLRERPILHRRMATGLIDAPEARREGAALIASHLDSAKYSSEAGQWYLVAGKYSFERAASQNAVELFRAGIERVEPGDREPVLEALDLLSTALHSTGRSQEAVETCRRLLDLSRGDAKWEVTALLGLFRLLSDLGDLDEAESLLDEARALQDRLDEADLIAQIAIDGAWLAERRSDFGRAVRLCREALRREDLSATTRARLDYALGWALHRQGKLEEAADLFGSAIERAGEDVVVGAVQRLRSGLGVVLQNLGKNEDARIEFERLIEEARATGNSVLEASSLNSLGLCLRAEGHFDTAREAFERSLELFRRRGSAFAEIVVRNLALIPELMAQHREKG